MPRIPSWAHVSLKLSLLLVGVSGNREMDGFSSSSSQLSGDGDLVLFMKSPCLSIE
jgi:hypothetical protein